MIARKIAPSVTENKQKRHPVRLQDAFENDDVTQLFQQGHSHAGCVCAGLNPIYVNTGW